MKKHINMLFISLLILIISGCNADQAAIVSEIEEVTGHIVIEGNTLYLNEVEIILSVHRERIAELGL